MTAKRRPKVRFTSHKWPVIGWCVHEYDHAGYVAKCKTGRNAKRIAAALNVYEAQRRGEL